MKISETFMAAQFTSCEIIFSLCRIFLSQRILLIKKTILMLKVFRTCDSQSKVVSVGLECGWLSLAGPHCLLLSGVLLRKGDVRDQGGEENGLQHTGIIYSNHRNIDKEFSKKLF